MSINNIPIRLTEERWKHISQNHDDMIGYYTDVLETVQDPEFILLSYNKSLCAIRHYSRNKHLCVIYKEISRTDGFIITAYFTKKFRLKENIILCQKK